MRCFRLLLVLSLLITGAAGMGGCRIAKRVTAKIQGPELRKGARPIVDVSNWNGSVQIWVSSKYSRAKVGANIRRARRWSAPNRWAAAREAEITAVSEQRDDGRYYLTVSSETEGKDPLLSRAEVVVRLPDCGGVTVRNSGGLVELRGVAGPINVENGQGDRRGGRVELRTGEAMTEPVTIITTEGTVYYQVDQDSTGQFELTAEGGEAAFDARVGHVQFGNYETSRITATLNRGTNPVILRSMRGSVVARMIENARTYRPSRWTGLPFWRTEPPR
jgi:hypothetical protein